MDVFEAVDSRIACRAFLNKPVDLNIVRELIVRAQRAASGGNLQSWNVYALANRPLEDLKRIVAPLERPALWQPIDAHTCEEHLSHRRRI